MIKTQYIKNTSTKPVEVENFENINVLKWNNSKWKALCPYYLKTDGNERCFNRGNVLFENYYQGCKVYDIVYENSVYPSVYHMNKPEYLWWKYSPICPTGDVLCDDSGCVNMELYLRWRDSLWDCPNPIRYPNKRNLRKNTRYSICIDANGNVNTYDYISARKEIYVKEYIRLIKHTKEYAILLDKVKKGQNIMICEIDVPKNGKKSEYGKDCDANDACDMTIEKLEKLMNDPSEAFGHGLCLAYSLLLDLYDL